VVSSQGKQTNYSLRAKKFRFAGLPLDVWHTPAFSVGRRV